MSHPPAASVAPTNKYFYIKMLCYPQNKEKKTSQFFFEDLFIFIFTLCVFLYVCMYTMYAW